MAATVELVTSVCREPAAIVVAALESYGVRLVEAGFAHAAVILYCKCVQHSRCDAILPNVGREAHTWLHHLALGRLADVTVFVNPGFCSGAHAAGLWHKAFVLGQVVGSLMRLGKADRVALQHTYSDGVDHPVTASLCRVPVEAGGCVGTLSRWGRRALSAEHRRCRNTAPTTISSSAGGATIIATRPTTLVGYCSNATTRCAMCTGFATILKCAECACEPQHETCVWNGASDRAQRAARPPPLKPARPPSFAAWACRHWSISPLTVQRCRWQWTGTFAVGAALVQQRNATAYAAVAAILAGAGREAGMEGHYMERLWRAIFYCSLGGRCIHDPTIVPTHPEAYLYPGSRYERADWDHRVPLPDGVRGGAPVQPFWGSATAASIGR